MNTAAKTHNLTNQNEKELFSFLTVFFFFQVSFPGVLSFSNDRLQSELLKHCETPFGKPYNLTFINTLGELIERTQCEFSLDSKL